jgi:methylmalonyl-CoA mutase cobalamin-binding subunit
MSTGLEREDIRALLADLSEELAARGARAELFLVGGTALAVAYDATRATRDLDAVFIPSDVVRQAATAVAEREGLADDCSTMRSRDFCLALTRMRSGSIPATR